MFGTLHPNWESADFLGDFANLAVTQGRPAVFATVGSLGCGEADFDRLAASWAAKIRFIRFGRLGEADLSRVFARFDFAATTVPWNILGKSGSVAALREHGLRVVVTAAGAPPRFGAVRPDDATRDPGCVPYWRDRALLPAVFAKTSPRWGVETVAESFLAGLSEDYPI
jgi:hypothetical protein